MAWHPHVDLEALRGLTFTKVFQTEYDGNDAIQFDSACGRSFVLGHRQDCCEQFDLTEVHGDLSDLENSPLVEAYESSNSGNTEYGDTETWTFYRLATHEGYVVLRFHGASNGYYSESADLYEIT